MVERVREGGGERESGPSLVVQRELLCRMDAREVDRAEWKRERERIAGCFSLRGVLAGTFSLGGGP